MEEQEKTREVVDKHNACLLEMEDLKVDKVQEMEKMESRFRELELQRDSIMEENEWKMKEMESLRER